MVVLCLTMWREVCQILTSKTFCSGCCNLKILHFYNLLIKHFTIDSLIGRNPNDSIVFAENFFESFTKSYFLKKFSVSQEFP